MSNHSHINYNNSNINSGINTKIASQKQCFRKNALEIPSMKYLLEFGKNNFGNKGGFNSKINGNWQFVGLEDFCNNCSRFVTFLENQHLTGKHIALIGDNSSQWLQNYFGTICSGSVIVPMDKELDNETLIERMEFAHCQALIFASDYEELAQEFLQNNPEKKAFSFNEIDEILTTLEMAKFPDIDGSNLATIVFSSGTTGLSKGIMLSHKNLTANAESSAMMNNIIASDVGLSMLPPNHSYELVANIMTTFTVGGIMNINDSLRNIQSNMKKFAPTVLAVVPVILETIKRGIIAGARKQGQLKKLEFAMKINHFCRTHGFDMGKTLFQNIHDQFGGGIRFIVCGGARLEPAVENFFRDLGFQILQGYGITECSPVISANTFWQNRTGSVGLVLPGNHAKIVDEEVWVTGENIMLGYYQDEKATQEVIEDGWFKTGDIGKFDDDGFLYLLGRKKNIIILSNGENVNPEELEGTLSQISSVADVLVYEENRLICGEFYLENASDSPETYQWLQSEVDKLNLKLPAYKRVSHIKIRNSEFPKTTTHKIKRY